MNSDRAFSSCFDREITFGSHTTSASKLLANPAPSILIGTVFVRRLSVNGGVDDMMYGPKPIMK
jgi:hypothetical protein